MFLSKIQASSSLDRSPLGDFFFQPIGMKSVGGVRVDSVQAMRLSAVYSAIRVRAEAFAVLPFELYRRKGGRRGRGELVTDHWLYRLLARRPNRFQTPFEWKEMMAGHLDLRGNAFNDIVANGRGEITDLLPIHPDRITIVPYVNGDYGYDVKMPDGTVQRRTRGDIWHVRGLSSDGVVGLNPIEVARDVLGLGLAAQAFGAKYFANDAKPGGWIEMPLQAAFKDDDEKKKFGESWHRSYSGSNRGKTAILEKGMKYHELTLNNSDAQFIETRKMTRSEIAAIFRVPPHKIGDLERATFSNIEQQSLEFVTDAITPMAERFESSIETNLLGDEAEELEAEFNLANLVRGDMAGRGAFYNRLFNLGALSPDDIRVREGDEPLPDGQGDKYFVPLNMVPLDQVDKIDRSGAGKPGEPANTTDLPGSEKDDSNAGLVAVAQAACERVARKELQLVMAAIRLPKDKAAAAVRAAYDELASYAETCLAITPDVARAYCDDRLGNITATTTEQDFLATAQSQLERLVLKGQP